MQIERSKVIRLLVELIEQSGNTPLIRVDLLNPTNRNLAQQIECPSGYGIFNISRRSFRCRRIHRSFISGEMRLKDRNFKVKIPLFTIASIYAKENKIGWDLPQS